MKKKIAMLTGGFAVLLVLGFGIYKSDASQADPKLNYDEVTGLILSQYPGTITEIELEKENNRNVYEIEIVNDEMEYDLKVDGNSGEIINLKEKKVAGNLEDQKGNEENSKKHEETKVEKKKNVSKENKNTVIDASDAITIALNEFTGTVTDVEFDEDDGRYSYEIEIKEDGLKAEVEIDAMTGEIIIIEIDED
ncbi:PepSY domain-containing protein [Pseudogracilibacillus sp. SE30717A]|uniref:PepSY domain-containing protein n=1 Tax=Pseudogracilibacillus sp. SE30717A TaxID=3098293 RepID=UPI00300E14B6